MKDTDRIAKAEAGLELAGTPEGFDALGAADLMRARGGLALFVARDLPRANAFADGPMTGSARRRASPRSGWPP